MSTEVIGINPGIDVELAYRRERLLAEAASERLARAARGPRSRLIDRLIDRLRGRGRRVVAAREAHGLHA
jgi:hypothetical protein